MEISQLQAGFVASGIPEPLVGEILASYEEAKRRFHLGDHRPQAVEGGRFTEGVFRILQHFIGLDVTPLGKTLPSVDKLIVQFANSGNDDSERVHIPRTLRLLYDIRNKRDAAHLADGIDANLQDATLVIANMDWVMAELVRKSHAIDADSAAAMIQDLVTKEVLAVQEIHGQPVILSDLQPRDQALLMVYRAGSDGVDVDTLAGSLRIKRKDHLRARLEKLDVAKLVLNHPKDGRCYITNKGIQLVEERRLTAPL